MAVQIQLRRDTATNWTTTDPILAEGEWGYETDTGKYKVGDGVNLWSVLSYVVQNGSDGADGSDGDYYHFIFKRSSTTPDTPTGNGTPATWSDTPPAPDGNKLWMSLALKLPNGDLPDGGSWSAPIQLEGADGTLEAHTHGNVTNDGKIGSTADLVIVTGTAGVLSAKTAGTSDQFLRGDGSWAEPSSGGLTDENKIQIRMFGKVI